jgi:hypothetical protein
MDLVPLQFNLNNIGIQTEDDKMLIIAEKFKFSIKNKIVKGLKKSEKGFLLKFY